eukprot:IDg1817t1
MTTQNTQNVAQERACAICNDTLSSSMSLGRHNRRLHRCTVLNDESYLGNDDALQDLDDDSEVWLEHVTSGVADDVFDFFDLYDDNGVLLFDKEAPLLPASLGEAKRYFELETASAVVESCCQCQSALKEQFKNADCFAQCFQKVMPIVIDVIRTAGGYGSIEPFVQKERDGRRLYSKLSDSDAMRMYTSSHIPGARIVCIDLYADGTQLARCGSQSTTPVRMRVSNVRGHGIVWHEVGIAPVIPNQSTYTDSKLSQEMLVLLHRFLYLLLRDALIASRSGFIVDSKIVFIRIANLVCDQKQERQLICLKSVGSFMDCSLCLKPTRVHNGEENSDGDGIPDSVRHCTADQIYAMQTSPVPDSHEVS